MNPLATKKPPASAPRPPARAPDAAPPPNEPVVVVVQQQQQQGGGGDGPPSRFDGVALSLALAVPIVLSIIFASGHGQLDQPEPDQDGARAAFILTIVLAVVVLGLSGLVGRFNGLLGILTGAAVGVPLAFWLVEASDNFGPDSDAGFSFLSSAILGLALYGVAVAVALAASRDRRPASVVGHATGAAFATAYLIAATNMLSTLDEKARMAREAWERDSPGLGLVLVLAVLAVAVLARRRVNRT